MKKLLIALLVLSLAATAYGAERFKIRSFMGLNTRLNPYEIKDNESPDMANFVLDEAGSLTERPLFQRYNEDSAGPIPITDLFKFYESNDVGHLICAGGTQLFQATGGALDPILTANTVTTYTDWGFEKFVSGSEEWVFAANTDTELLWWDGSLGRDFGECGGGPDDNISILKVHKSRLFGSGSDEYPYRVYYSSLSEGNDWATTGGTLDLPTYEKIMALEVLGDILYIFTRANIYALYGDTPNEFNLRPTHSNYGTHARRSVVKGDKLIFFLNKAGVFVFDGYQSTNLSEPILPTIEGISSTYLDKAAGVYDKNGRYWLSCASSGSTLNDQILVYDVPLKQWYLLNSANFASLIKLDGGTDTGQLYAGCSDRAGWLWQLQRGSAEEQIIINSLEQLNDGVTFNTVIWDVDNPTLRLLGGAFGDVGEATSSDPYTTLLCHFDGADEATTSVDSSLSGHTLTLNGNAQLDTSEARYGPSSIYFDGSGDFVTVPASNDWVFGTDDFTIEFWVNFASELWGQPDTYGMWFIDAYTSGLPWVGWSLGCDQNTDRHISFAAYDSGGTTVAQYSADFEPTIDTWYHIAVERYGSECLIFIDGEQQTVTEYTSFADLDAGGTLYIGRHMNISAAWYWDANDWMDEIRISKGIARYTGDFDPGVRVQDGWYASDNFTINVTGATALGTIEWNETIDGTWEDLQVTTRTGATDATVDYDGWETWVSTNVVSIDVVSDDFAAWTSVDTNTMTVMRPIDSRGIQARDVWSYETDDDVSPPSVQFEVSRGTATITSPRVAWRTFPETDIDQDTFIGYWLMSPSTGDSVILSIGEVTPNIVGYITANTIEANTWEYHYWNLSDYASTDLDYLTFMQLQYIGDMQGSIYLGDVYAYDFYDNGDLMTSTPDNQLQFRVIEASVVEMQTPEMNFANGFIIKFTYASVAGSEEGAFLSKWFSKPLDFKSEYNKNFHFVELTAKSMASPTDNIVSISWDCDDGDRTGCMEDTFPVSDERVKLRYWFPSGTWGKEIQLEITDNVVDSDLVIYNLNLSYTLGAGDGT